MELKIDFHRRKDQKRKDIIIGTLQNEMQKKKCGKEKSRPSVSCGTTEVAKQLHNGTPQEDQRGLTLKN